MAHSRKKLYLKTYLSNSPNTVDQIQIQIHGLKFDQIQIQIRRICICICICKYKYVFDPSPDGPPVEIFFNSVKQHTPGACMLDAWEVRHHNISSHVDLPVLSPEAKMSVFLSCHNCSNSVMKNAGRS